jgi:hypothetical protein
MPTPLSPCLTIILAASMLLTAGAQAGDSERAARQAELDRICEAAREEKLAPLRQRFVQECVDDAQFETREECEAFYADYGAQSGNRAPLFYDLPPCVEAFEYAQSERSGG